MNASSRFFLVLDLVLVDLTGVAEAVEAADDPADRLDTRWSRVAGVGVTDRCEVGDDERD